MSDKKRKTVFHLILCSRSKNSRFITRAHTPLPALLLKRLFLALETMVKKVLLFLYQINSYSRPLNAARKSREVGKNEFWRQLQFRSEAGFLVRVHPDPCLILIRAHIHALLCASKSQLIRAKTLTLPVLDKKDGLSSVSVCLPLAHCLSGVNAAQTGGGNMW
jgi:hypothetical protein